MEENTYSKSNNLDKALSALGKVFKVLLKPSKPPEETFGFSSTTVSPFPTRPIPKFRHNSKGYYDASGIPFDPYEEDDFELEVSYNNGDHYQDQDDDGRSLWESLNSLDLNPGRITKRVNHQFFPNWGDGVPPFSSLYFVHIIMALGLLIAITYLLFALLYYTLVKIGSLCPTCKWRCKCKRRRKIVDEETGPKEPPTLEQIEKMRAERLAILQREFEHLENQLTEERTNLTSRASDSDLEYLGFWDDTPPLKRNSISMQDIPQSVVRIRRDKQLRQLKEEIDQLHTLSQGENLDKMEMRSPLLKDIQFNFPSSPSQTSSTSPVETHMTGEHLRQRIAHLKAQRKLDEIRSDLEDLAIHLVHHDEIKAKTSSLQDLPRTALGLERQEKLLSLAKDVEHVKTYKMQHKSILSTVFTEPDYSYKLEALTRLNSEPSIERTSSQKRLLEHEQQQSFEMEESGDGGKTKEGKLGLSPSQGSIKRRREQEMERVRLELRGLSDRLNLKASFEENV